MFNLFIRQKRESARDAKASHMKTAYAKRLATQIFVMVNLNDILFVDKCHSVILLSLAVG
jgi:hypothetical protein